MSNSIVIISTEPFVFSGKLIKSSVYRVNGVLARFTGDYDTAQLPIFKVHDTGMIYGGTVEKVTREEVMTYMGR